MRRHGPNWPIAFASLVLSVMLWFVVYAQNVPVPEPVNAPLAIDGLDDARVFLRKFPSEVRLMVNAPAERAKDLATERVTASVDLSGATPGTHDYPVALSPDWVRRYLDDPRPKVRIVIEAMAKRTMKIESVVTGALPNRNLLLKAWKLSPTQVTVRGPASEVASVQRVRAYVDLAKVNPLSQEPQESDLVPLDDRDARPPHVTLFPSSASSTFSLVAAAASKLVEVVPDLDGVTYDPSVIPDGYRIDPATVMLTGKPTVLANVSKVPTARVGLRGVARTQRVRVRLLAPSGTSILESSEVSVIVRVRSAPKPVVTPPSGASATSPTFGVRSFDVTPGDAPRR